MSKDIDKLLDRIEARLTRLEQYMFKSRGIVEAFAMVLRFIGPILVLIGIIEFVSTHGFIK